MERKRISEGNLESIFNFNKYSDSLIQIQAYTEQRLESISNEPDSEDKVNKLNGIKKEIEAYNEIINNPETKSNYLRFMVGTEIDTFIKMLASSFRMGESNLITNGVLNLNYIKEICDHYSLDEEDLKRFVYGKTVFQLIDELYTMAGLEFPNGKLEMIDEKEVYNALGYVDIYQYYTANEVYKENNTPQAIGTPKVTK